jgi:hypothetical protein
MTGHKLNCWDLSPATRVAPAVETTQPGEANNLPGAEAMNTYELYFLLLFAFIE